MRKVTSTKRINDAIANNLLQIEKAEVYYKTSHKTETINANIFRENLASLFESGIFADSIGWHYERDYKSNDYIVECGRMNPDTEIIVTAYLSVGENVSREVVERMLCVNEEGG